MENIHLEDNHNSTGIPRYLWVIFGVIVCVICFGIYERLFAIPNNPAVKGATDQAPDVAQINVIPLPTPIDSQSNPDVYAKNVILLDDATKYPLFIKNDQEQVPIASITKVMTSIITLASGRLDEVVTITPEDVAVTGSKIGLVSGEKIKVSELLRGLLIQSGNDCAMALARTIGDGSIDAFVSKMNIKAAELNLLQTHYADPHGLGEQSRSSAFDQSILLSYAINFPKFKEIISTPQATITSENGKTHDLTNSNRLITNDMKLDYVIGGKTGFTLEAGHSLVCAASKDGHTLISVVLNTIESTNTASAKETKKLLEWGFSNFTWQ